MQLSLTPELERFIQEQVERGRYPSASEVVREALRLLKEREDAQAQLEQLLLEGIESGPPVTVTPEYWAEKRARLREQGTQKAAP